MGRRYRLPKFKVGPQVYMYNQVKDKKPWSLVERSVPEHWAKTQGEGVRVAVLDTGLWKHRDLPEPAFAKNFTDSPDVYDVQGHGSHVAGTVGARQDGAGVVGWAPKCEIGCCKVLDDEGTGDSYWIADGIRYAVEEGAHIINMSLGGGPDDIIADACRDAIQEGVFVICAAGNEGDMGGINTIGWPARLRETIAVASYRRDGKISDYSSRGPEVDVAFPGEDILSTWLDNQFRKISGTSMATPACSGLTALMLARHWEVEKKGELKTPIRNNTQLREHFKRFALDRGEEGHDRDFGWGIPDVGGLITDENGVKAASVLPAIAAGRFGVKPLHHDGRDGLFVWNLMEE